jgi:hypothetical protein
MRVIAPDFTRDVRLVASRTNARTYRSASFELCCDTLCGGRRIRCCSNT